MHSLRYNSAHDTHLYEGSYLQEGWGTHLNPFLSIYHAGVLGL